MDTSDGRDQVPCPPLAFLVFAEMMGTIDTFSLFRDIPAFMPHLRDQVMSMPGGSMVSVMVDELEDEHTFVFVSDEGRSFQIMQSQGPTIHGLSLNGVMARLNELIAEYCSNSECPEVQVAISLPQSQVHQFIFCRTEADRREAQLVAQLTPAPVAPILPAAPRGAFQIDMSRVRNGHKGVIHHNPKETEFIDSSITNMERKNVPLNSRNFVYLESEIRNDGTVPRIYNRRGLEAVRNGKNRWSRKDLRHNNLRRLPRLNRNDLM
jgi:hypothetical protein